MAKWKCEICEKEFDNFHAQGFDSKIYCPLCFFKEKTNRLEKENKQLKDNWNELKKRLEEVEFIVGLRQKRNLIHKFDKEYDDDDKKKNPNRDYAGTMPDAEEVYRRYYSMKNQQKKFIEYLEDEKDRLARVCNNICEDKFDEVNDILQKYKAIIGGEEVER